jgi:hypothetical protein
MPWAPVAPAGPVAPAAPVAPFGPAGPAGPCAPAGPARARGALRTLRALGTRRARGTDRARAAHRARRARRARRTDGAIGAGRAHRARRAAGALGTLRPLRALRALNAERAADPLTEVVDDLAIALDRDAVRVDVAIHVVGEHGIGNTGHLGPRAHLRLTLDGDAQIPRRAVERGRVERRHRAELQREVALVEGDIHRLGPDRRDRRVRVVDREGDGQRAVDGLVVRVVQAALVGDRHRHRGERLRGDGERRKGRGQTQPTNQRRPSHGKLPFAPTSPPWMR